MFFGLIQFGFPREKIQNRFYGCNFGYKLQDVEKALTKSGNHEFYRWQKNHILLLKPELEGLQFTNAFLYFQSGEFQGIEFIVSYSSMQECDVVFKKLLGSLETKYEKGKVIIINNEFEAFLFEDNENSIRLTVLPREKPQGTVYVLAILYSNESLFDNNKLTSK